MAATGLIASCDPTTSEHDPPAIAQAFLTWPSTSGIMGEAGVRADGGCGLVYCGDNAATVLDGIVFTELDASGRFPNPAGVKIIGATFAGLPAKLDVGQQRDLRVLVDEPAGPVYKSGAALAGQLKIQLGHANGAQYELLLEHYQQVRAWANHGGNLEVASYRFLFRMSREPDGQTWRRAPNCQPENSTAPLLRAAALPRPVAHACVEEDFTSRRMICRGEQDDTTMQSHLAIVFEGDRYDLGNKTIREFDKRAPLAAGAADGEEGSGAAWFNLACAGTAAAKMHLLNQTRAGVLYQYPDPVPARSTTIAQRQAVLKMLTADYYGNGQSFTVNGRPLLYTDSEGWFPFRDWVTVDVEDQGAIASIEAVWGPDGAVCLDTPRMASIDDVTRYRDDYLPSHPPIPRCTPALPTFASPWLRAHLEQMARQNLAQTWRQLGYVLSVNPRLDQGPATLAPDRPRRIPALLP